MNIIRLLNLNIEGHRHLERIIQFLTNNHFDLIMLQEVFEDDITKISSAVQIEPIFKPALLKDNVPWGNVCFSKVPHQKYLDAYYVGSETQVKEYDHNHPENQCKSIVGTSFLYNDKQHTILSTHFTWSPQGQPTDKQRIELQKLFDSLNNYSSFVMSGDFNTPRGTEIFDTMATKYKDNIPQHITTTIDGNFHKAGHLPYVVDGLFSTQDYLISNVKVIDGLSDHCAITAEITL